MHINIFQRTTFTIKEEMGFDDDESKQLMVTVPKIWHISKYFQQ